MAALSVPRSRRTRPCSLSACGWSARSSSPSRSPSEPRSRDSEEVWPMDTGGTKRERRNDEACLRCGSRLDYIGVEDFRTGGTTGGWKLLFGELAELGEGMLKLEVRA